MLETLRALEQALMIDPDDEVLYLAIIDRHQEEGKKPLTAKRLANAARRAAQEAQAVAAAVKLLNADDHRGRTARGTLKSVAGMSHSERPAFVVVPGDAGPTRSGEAAFYTFKDSDTRVRAPGAAMRAGYKVTYHRSTLTITVGAYWVLKEFGIRKLA